MKTEFLYKATRLTQDGQTKAAFVIGGSDRKHHVAFTAELRCLDEQHAIPESSESDQNTRPIHRQLPT